MEVKRINRQKFLAELGRLLTFMYEEDRQMALAMYNKMFDEAESEQALLQYLVSPTRQAVILARAYNAKERKLQVHTQSRDEYEQSTDETPDFVLAINKLQNEASALKITVPQISEDQISLFDDAVIEIAPAAAPAAQENAEPAADEETQAAAAEAPVQNEVPPMFRDEPAGEEEPDETNSSVTRLADAVDAFLADFTISNDELIPKAKPAADEEEPAEPEKNEPAEEPEAAEEPAAEEVPAEQPDEPEQDEPVQTEHEEPEAEDEEIEEDAENYDDEEYDEDEETVRKPIVPLLILYIIFAIPLGLIGILLLLVPAFVALSLAVTAGFLGAYGIAAMFSGFAVLADILVVAGVSMILLVLALLFLWMFIWFIGGAIVSLIRGLCILGGKWCYKEVAVQ